MKIYEGEEKRHFWNIKSKLKTFYTNITQIQYPVIAFRIILLFLKCSSFETPVILFDVMIAGMLTIFRKAWQDLRKTWQS
jgi:hypothetical protein